MHGRSRPWINDIRCRTSEKSGVADVDMRHTQCHDLAYSHSPDEAAHAPQVRPRAAIFGEMP